MEKNSRLVYSTNPSAQTKDPAIKSSSAPKKTGTAKIMLDKKGRKGKSVTIVDGLAVNPQHLADIAKQLKQFLGTGGTAKQGRIEIQGDHRNKIAEKLEALGFKTKFSGG